MSLEKIAKELKILTDSHFWTLDNPIYDFTDAKTGEWEQEYVAFKALVGSDLEDDDGAIDEFLESSTGLTTLTIFSKKSYYQPFSTLFSLENEEEITYQDIINMILSLPRPDGKNDWVDDIVMDPDHLNRLIVTLNM